VSYSTAQHYLIKTKDHLSYFFYINDEKKLHYKLFNSKAIYMKDEILTDSQIIDYSACIDSNDQIHIIYVDNLGQLKYVVGKNNSWNTKDLAKLDIASNNYSYFTLTIQNNIAHIIYIKTNLLNKVVSSIEHIYWDKSELVKNKITSYMPGKYISPFHMDIDSNGNIHIVYKGTYVRNNQLYYSKFNFNSKKWSATEIISDVTEDHSHPFILIDKNDSMHLCWCTVVNNNFVLNYKRKNKTNNVKDKWSEKVTLSDHKSNYISPVIIQKNQELIILSKQNESISETISNNYGLSWNTYNQENLIKAEKLLHARYYSNVQEENNQYKYRYIYIDVSDYIKSLGTDLYPDSKPTSHSINSIPEPKLQDLLKETNEEIAIQTQNPISNPIDEKVLNIIEDIDSYINDMELHIKKLIEIKSFLNSSKAHTDVQKDSANEQQINSIIKLIHDVENQLSILDEEKNELIKELNYYNKKIEYFENKLIDIKKQYLTLEEIINKDIVHEKCLLDKIINYFR